MSDEKLVPKLRFAGFDDEWIIKKLGDVSEINPKTSELPESFIYIDLESVNNGILTKYNQINKEDAPSRAQRCLEVNDILFQTVRPYQMNNLFFELNDGNYVASTGYAQIKAKIVPKFLYYYLHYNKFVNEVLNRCTGTSYPAINSNDLKKIKIKIPTSFKEQMLIGDLFYKIDEKIELLKQNYDYYQNFKKYLMQQIFAQKLRFDFDDEWKQYKLKELLTVKSSGISINQLEDNTGDYPLYGASGFIKNIDFCEMDRDYISIVKDGSGVGNLSYHEKNSSIVNTSQYLLPKDDYNIHFVYYLLQTLNLLKYVNGSSIPHIYFKDYCIEKVYVPNTLEQQKIGKLFVDIDNTLENINNSIQVTQEFKKGLLQQMFVYIMEPILLNFCAKICCIKNFLKS